MAVQAKKGELNATFPLLFRLSKSAQIRADSFNLHLTNI